MYSGFTILVVEDEKKIAEMVALYLKKSGFETAVVYDGYSAIKYFQTQKADLVILDLNLPMVSGEAVLTELRTQSDIPVVILTAKNDEATRVEGFVLGADDYVSKPFSIKELVERVKAVIKRTYKDRLETGALIQYGELHIDDRIKRATLSDQVLDLTANEFKLLSAMAKRPQQVFSREALAELVFDYDYAAQSRNIDTYIKNLRKKLKDDPRKPHYIQTRFGLGYQFGGESHEA